MNIETLLAFLLLIGSVHFVALVSPGPDFALILRSSVQKGKNYARWSALGLGLGVIFHVSYSIFALSFLMTVMPDVIKVLALVGCGYLLFQGYKSFRFGWSHRGKPANMSFDINTPAKATKNSVWSALSSGFLTNALNPKAFTYFISFFAVTVARIHSTPISLLAGLEVIVLTVLWFTFVAQIASGNRLLPFLKKYDFVINMVIGVAFMVFALSMLLFAFA